MERQAITVCGVVQGVGFRPFVYRLARRLQLNGFTKNRAGSVVIEVEGDRRSLDLFLEELQSQPPPLSRIDAVSLRSRPLVGEKRFRIESSDNESSSQIFISPDVATCDDCLAELFDPADRRYRYPFLNCTKCGPRLSIIEGAPYDRERTTMARFSMCAACQAEYDDPDNRRFHAQPTACPMCGPRLFARSANGERIDTKDPLAFFVARLREGKIGAVKGLGGYHLVCDASDDQVVNELRRRKLRDEKPFAVMMRDVNAVTRVCEVGCHERDLLVSHRRPIVLLQKQRGACRILPREPRGWGVGETNVDDSCPQPNVAVCEAVAPGNPFLGVMLPYTPLHHLLMEAIDGIPLVMTSGNRSDEPIAYLDEEAVQRLGDIADVFLTHDRPIHVRCDDSVTRIVDGVELPVRRSRGYAPQPVQLPMACPCPILAVGGQFKAVFALGRDRQAFLSHHMGDLDHFDAYRAFQRDILLYEQLFDMRPTVIVHDLHPDYASTRYALDQASNSPATNWGTGPIRSQLGAPNAVRSSGNSDLSSFLTLAVQHHHAHMASCMAEHGLDEPVIGVSFDGTGFGIDEAIWGGEFLVGDYSQFARAAHLRYVRMPGGDKAIREPWRMAISHLLDAGRGASSVRTVTSSQRRTVERMIDRGFNSPLTSSAGRLFDAVAALAGVRTRVSFEGQAAMELEWLASHAAEVGTYPFAFEGEAQPSVTRGLRWSSPVLAGTLGSSLLTSLKRHPTYLSDLLPFSIDTRPVIDAVANDVCQETAAEVIARRFHSTIVEMIAATCDRIRRETQLRAVVLSGGVFMNALLTREASARLTAAGFRVYRHRLVPPGDGGLSLGQLAIAARALMQTANMPKFEQRGRQAACPT